MSKYKVGDKVVLRKDLKDSEWYGANTWTDRMGNLLYLPYVYIIDSKDNGFAIKESKYKITNEMIQGLYKEEKEMDIKAGDKVRVIEDVKDCDTIKKGDIIEIDRVRGDIFYVKDHKLNDTESQFFLFESEFELVEENKKYIWYLDDENGTYFLYAKGLNIVKFNKNGTNAKNIKNGKENCMLLTEKEARQSLFFDKFKKHDPFEKWYYIRMKGNELYYLNLNFNDGNYFMDDNEEYGPHKSKFKEEECNEIIGTSSILYKEECQHD